MKLEAEKTRAIARGRPAYGSSHVGYEPVIGEVRLPARPEGRARGVGLATERGHDMQDEQDIDFAEDLGNEPAADELRPPVPDEFANPAGSGRGECDTEPEEAQDASCDLEATAQIEDMALGETKPGYGIAGYEGEEVGG